MKKELDEQLCREFPNVYRHRRAPMSQTAMCWGFECSDGWFKLLYDLSSKLEKLILEVPEADREAYGASQVKEKFGTLCFYMHGATDEMWDHINEAERQSHYTCEVCGNPGRTRSTGWVLTLCDPCHYKHVAQKVSSICRYAAKAGKRLNYKGEEVDDIVYEDDAKVRADLAKFLEMNFARGNPPVKWPGRKLYRWVAEMVGSFPYRVKYLGKGAEFVWFFRFYWQDLTGPTKRAAVRLYRKLRRRYLDAIR